MKFPHANDTAAQSTPASDLRPLSRAEKISAALTGQKHAKPRARRPVKAPPAGLPDARGWTLHPLNRSKRLEKFKAVAHYGSQPVERLFRDEETGRQWVNEQNEKLAAARGEEPRTEPLLTATELRASLNLSRFKLQGLLEKGCPFVKISAHDYRYYRSDVLAFLDAKRIAEPEQPMVFVVQPYSNRARPNYKYRVRGTGEWAGEEKPFATEDQARRYARARNSAVGRKAVALPVYVRGMDPNGPAWRVSPHDSEKRSGMHYKAFAYFPNEENPGGRPKERKRLFATEREALHFANQKNLEVAKLRDALERQKPAPESPAKTNAPEPPESAPTFAAHWTEAQMQGLDTARHRDPMKGPPYRLYPTTQKGYSFILRGPEGPDGKPFRKFFHSEREGRADAHMRNTEAQTQGLESIGFPSWLRVMAQRGQQVLQPHGKTIEDAVRFYADYLERTSRSCPLKDLIARFAETKKGSGVTRAYLHTAKVQMESFAAKVGAEMPVSEITVPMVDDYLLSLAGLAATSRNSIRRNLSTLFNFGLALGLCDKNPASKSAKAKEVPAPVGIFSPEQLCRLLACVPENVVPIIAIGAFAGLRTAELKRLDWEQVDLAEGYIEVTAKNAKSARRRIVKILPALDAWLRPHAKPKGRVCPFKAFVPHSHISGAMKAAGIDAWPRNALRHSFASYHLAQFKDAAALALEMGHMTTALIFEHYRQVVRATEAEKYWALRPPTEGVRKVVAFAPSSATA